MATEETLRTTREALAAAWQTEIGGGGGGTIAEHREGVDSRRRLPRGRFRGETSGDDDGDVGDDGDDDATSIRTVR